MKVKDLIKQLESLPKNLDIYWADHDHGKFEAGGKAGQVELIDKKNMNEYENDKGCGLSDCFTHTPKRYVLIRP